MPGLKRLLATALALCLLPAATAEELVGIASFSATPVSTPSADEIAGGREFNDEILEDFEEDEEGGRESLHAKVTLLERSASRFNNILNPSGVPDAGLPIPYVYQFNYDTPVCRVGKRERSVATSGCGAVCTSMLIAYMTGDMDQTPYTLMYRFAEEGNYYGNGLTYDAIAEMLGRWGIATELVKTKAEDIVATLEAGQPILIKMGPGVFTKNGHYILLRGLDAAGKVYVTDPNNAFHSAQSFDVGTIVKECRGGDKRMLLITSRPLTEEERRAAAATPKPTEAVAEDIPLKGKRVPKATPTPKPTRTPAPTEMIEPTPSDTPAPSGTPEPQLIAVRICNYRSVNLRERPDAHSRITGTAKKGARLRIVEKSLPDADGYAWYGVLDGGSIKYIREDLTDPV